VYFEECDSKNNTSTCLTKEKKQEFLSASSHWILTIENSEKFMPDEYDPAKIVRGQSLIDWKPLSYTQR